MLSSPDDEEARDKECEKHDQAVRVGDRAGEESDQRGGEQDDDDQERDIHRGMQTSGRRGLDTVTYGYL